MAVNASEPLEQPSDFGAGNAFAGSKSNRDEEMYKVIHDAIMDGDKGNSPIASADMRLASIFGSCASNKSKKDAEKSRAMYMQVMIQQLQKMRDDLRNMIDGAKRDIEQIESQLNATEQLREWVLNENWI